MSRSDGTTSRLSILTLGVIAVYVASGCSTVDNDAAADQAQARGPLPYHVGLFLDLDGVDNRWPDESTKNKEMRVRYESTKDDFLRLVAKSISIDRPVVSQVEILEATSRKEALAKARGLDLLIAVGFETSTEYSDYSRSPGWGTLEILSWLFGGIPSWFVPTVQHETPSRLNVEAIDLHRNSSGQEEDGPHWKLAVETNNHATSLWDRSSSFGDYALTIVAPPMAIVPGEEAVLSQSLTSLVNESLGTELGDELKEKLLATDWVNPLAVVFLSPDPLELIESESVTLKLSLANRYGSELRSFEVARLASDGDTIHWQASPNQLNELNKRFAALTNSSHYVPFVLPGEVPISPGGNLIKVKLAAANGESVVRTMFYVR